MAEESQGQPSLEKRIGERPHPGMDLMQFLVVTGMDYRWSELDENEALKAHVKEAYEDRQRQLSSRKKRVEVTISNGLKDEYSWERRSISNVQELRDHLDLSGRFRIRGVGMASALYINTIFDHFGLAKATLKPAPSQLQAFNLIGPYQPGTFPLRLDVSSRMQY